MNTRFCALTVSVIVAIPGVPWNIAVPFCHACTGFPVTSVQFASTKLFQFAVPPFTTPLPNGPAPSQYCTGPGPTGSTSRFTCPAMDVTTIGLKFAGFNPNGLLAKAPAAKVRAPV